MRRLAVIAVVLFAVAVAFLLAGCGGGAPASGSGSVTPAGKAPPTVTNPAVVYGKGGGLYLSNFSGSQILAITTPPNGQGDAVPTWSPDGKRIAFFRQIAANSYFCDLCVVNPDGTGLTTVKQLRDWSAPFPNSGGFSAAWTLDWCPVANKLVYPIDPMSRLFLGRSGGPNDVAVVDPASGQYQMLGIQGLQFYVDGLACGSFSAAGDGLVVFAGYHYDLADTNGDGKLEVTNPQPEDLFLLKVKCDASGWLSVAPGATPVPLHSAPASGEDERRCARFSPDGTKVAYFQPAPSGGFLGLMTVSVDAAGPTWGTPALWATPSTAVGGVTWSPDNRWIAYAENVGVPHGQYQTNYDIVRCLAGGASRTDMSNDTRNSEGSPDWNPAWDPTKP